MGFLLGIDSGLTVTKAALFDENGRTVAIARRSIQQSLPLPRHVERDMKVLWTETCSAIQELLLVSGISPNDISAISQTAHGDGLYLLDKSHQPLGPGILSLDSRAIEEVALWEANGTSDAMLRLSGQRPHVSSPAALLSWIKSNDPRRYGRIGAILSCKDWLSFCLTGVLGTDRTEASTAFSNVQTQHHETAILERYDLKELSDALPPVLHSAEVIGTVSREAAEKTGLRQGTPVATGLHDVTASSLGMGAHRQGCYALVAGTYSINQVVSDTPKTDSRWFCRNAIEPGLWNVMAISPASTTNYEWFIKTFCSHEAAALEEQGASIHDVLAHEACASDVQAPIYHPFLFGSPYGAQASASLIGLQGWQDRGAIVASILEGIVFNHKHHIDDLDHVFSPTEVRVCGGVTRNPAVPQLFSDALGRPVGVSDVDEPAAQGAATCAGVATGIFSDLTEASEAFAPNVRKFEPDPKAQARLADRFGIYQEAASSLASIWTQLEQALVR
ncbi:MAG: FGGY-family carbohydrate kinase [Paracoccaceae bacterium]